MTFQRDQPLGNPNILSGLTLATIATVVGSIGFIGIKLSSKSPEERASSIQCNSLEIVSIDPTDTPKDIARELAENEGVNPVAYLGHLLDKNVQQIIVDNGVTTRFVPDTTQITAPIDCYSVLENKVKRQN
jgi:hypothetical protein